MYFRVGCFQMCHQLNLNIASVFAVPALYAPLPAHWCFSIVLCFSVIRGFKGSRQGGRGATGRLNVWGWVQQHCFRDSLFYLVFTDGPCCLKMCFYVYAFNLVILLTLMSKCLIGSYSQSVLTLTIKYQSSHVSFSLNDSLTHVGTYPHTCTHTPTQSSFPPGLFWIVYRCSSVLEY